MSEEKTEQPTSKRLRDARKKGQVAHSKEISSTATLLGIFTYFLVAHKWIYQQFIEMIHLPAKFYGVPFNDALPQVFTGVATYAMLISLPALVTVIIAGLAANYFQVGPLLSFEPIIPKLEKLNPAEKFKQIFSMKNFVEFLKSAIKVLFLGVLIYRLIRNSIPTLVYVPNDGLDGVVRVLHLLMFNLAVVTTFAYVVIAVFDYLFQKKQHTKQLMMTKQEVKQEHKENEGDPTIKSRRKQLHRELANDQAVKKTKNSTVLVTNPTHYAIALYYEKGITRLPIMLAKAKGPVALRMMAVAEEENIPIMRNIPLARALYADGSIDNYIPRDFIEPVAEVLKAVSRLKRAQGLEHL
ncbi:type III secretion system export apparatus subunit SctU [Thalassoglobus sp. JC818]|uniref:type III secretion system export apparatus subunit SctU n=1 Tax=Thalassoglobus sp. JC818 TaxID=3232136 RepID=UPI00345934FA